MLSLNPVKNVDHAKSYFMGGDNYYMKEGEGKSIWWGKGAEALGLAGAVQRETFESLLKGHLPNGEMLGKMVDGELQHRPGFDLTFSIPKSASIMALRSEDKSVYDSIMQSTIKAVEKTLGIIEHSSAQVRVTQKGNTHYINTKNLAVAMHMHELSREDEADIHVHCVVMNMTQRSDGKWRSLASSAGYYGKNATTEINGFFERVGNQKKQLGAIFRGELAYDLKQKGFPIVVTDRKQGFFEMDGISKELMSAHSTRSEQIKTHMDKHGFAGGTAAALATQITRRSKSKKSQELIKQEWAEKEKIKGADAIKEVSTIIEKTKNGAIILSGKIDLQPSFIQARAAVEHAMDVLSETQIKITPIQLINFSMKNALGENINLEVINHVINEMRAEDILVPIEQKNGELYYTTKELLQYEKEVIQAIAVTVPDKMKIAPAKIQHFLERQKNLKKDQLNAIQTIFLSENRITALEGKSHTGKTTLIKPMAELAKKNGYEPIILTPNKAGSLAIQDEIRKAPRAIQRFFNQLFDQNHYTSVTGFIYGQLKSIEAGTQTEKKRMIFVDNAQLLSLKQMKDLSIVTEKTNARLVPLFDRKAMLAFQSGNPLQQMLDHGMKTAVLQEVVDRTCHPSIQGAVKDTLEGNIKSAFKKMNNRLLTIENKEQRTNLMASMYAALTSDERKQTQVILPSRAQCDEVNRAIHEALKKEQQISSESTTITLLIPKPLKTAEYRLAEHYQIGQWVRFNEKQVSLGVKKDDYFKIIGIDKHVNQITLANTKEKMIQWNPLKVASTKIELFEEKIREIAKGETLICRRNHFKHRLSSGEQLKVHSFSSKKWVLERENHKKVSIDMTDHQNRHFDYGYALTPHAAVHKKVDTVIAYQNAYSRQSHQRVFYKVLSQAKKNIWILTENKQELLNNIQKNTGNKDTVMDTLINDVPSLLRASTSKEEHLKLLEEAIRSAITSLSNSIKPLNKTPESVSKEAVSYALAHLAEREAAFQHKDVMTIALKHVLGEANTDHIWDAVVQAEKDGILVRGIYSSDGTRWTTREAINLEREIIALAKVDQGKMPALIESSKVENYLATHPMKKDHTNAIREWMAAEDRVVVVQGDAGTGKTTMLERAEPLLKSETFLNSEGYTLLCLAPTHVVVDELKSHGLTAQTLDSFLSAQRLAHAEGTVKKLNNKLIIAVDENSMISNRRERDFLSIIREIEARAILIGDQRQYASIESGKPHTLLQSIGIKTIHLYDIVRQKTHTLVQGVQETYHKQYKEAFETLKERITEIGQSEGEDGKKIDVAFIRHEKIADDYLSLSPLERAKTGVLALGNAQRISINDIIREGLKKEGTLCGEPLTTRILVSQDMTKVEHTKSINFKINDIVRFGVNVPHLNIKKGDYLSIEKLHEKENLITLRNPNGERIAWQPKQGSKENDSSIEVYCAETREIMPGDLIRWTRSDKAMKLISPKLARVESVYQEKVVLSPVKLTDEGISSDGKPFEMDARDPKYQHWDYAHVMTSYGAQGKGFKNVLADMTSYSRYLTNQVAFLIVLTRSIDNLTIYTDDKKALLNKIIKTAGGKTSALETVGEVTLEDKRNHPVKPQVTVKKIAENKKSKDRINSKNKLSPTYKSADEFNKNNPKNWSLTEKAMVSLSRQWVRESLPIKGTLAEKYLREHCKISLNIPSDIRFHPGISSDKGQPEYPALLAIGRNQKGQIQRVEAIYLDEKTAKKAEIDVKKMTYAPVHGSSVNLSRNIKNKQVTYLAERIETGLSILQSVDNGNVEVVLGKSNFKHPSLKNLAQNVVICLDNDGREPTDVIKKQIEEAAIALHSHGKTLWIASPNEADKNYNDLLKEQGTRQVRESIEQAILYKDYANNLSFSSVSLKEHLANSNPTNSLFIDGKAISNVKKTEIRQEKIMTVNHTLTHSVSDKFINNFAKSHPIKQHEERDYSKAYKSINNSDYQKEIEKTVNKINNFEQEI